jgi:hypothetical protein
MLARINAGLTPAAAKREARSDVQAGEQDGRPNKPSNNEIIRAELIGSDQCTARGITVRGDAPILILCRKLIEAGLDPTTPLVAYRGKMACIFVTTIGKAAALDINGRGTGFKKYRCRVGIASSMRPKRKRIPLPRRCRGAQSAAARKVRLAVRRLLRGEQ